MRTLFKSSSVRVKNDRIDSLDIARYCTRYIDKKVDYKPDSAEIDSLRLLSSYRGRLIKSKVALQVAAKETRRVMPRDATAKFVHDNSMREIENLNKQIEEVEEKMLKIVMESDLKTNYLLILSIKGVGMITAVEMLIHTDNFKSFETARQIACYCGCVPFPNESGKTKKGDRISHLANKNLKVLLTNCARSATQYNPELRDYYNRKISEGKLDRVAINNVRNKLVHRIFAVVKSGKPYQANYLNSLAQSA